MTYYSLREPVQAVQYRLGANEREVFHFVKGDRRSSSTNQNGYLRIYNDGIDVRVQPGEWVAKFGSSILVLSDELFDGLFVVQPDVD